MTLDDYPEYHTIEDAFADMTRRIRAEDEGFALSYQGTSEYSSEPHLLVQGPGSATPDWLLSFATPSSRQLRREGAFYSEYKGDIYEPTTLRLQEIVLSDRGDGCILERAYPTTPSPVIAKADPLVETLPSQVLPLVSALGTWRGRIARGWRSLLVHGFQWPGIDPGLHRRLQEEQGLECPSDAFWKRWNGYSLRYSFSQTENVYEGDPPQRMVLFYLSVFPARFLPPALEYRTELPISYSLDRADQALARMRRARDMYALLLRTYWS